MLVLNVFLNWSCLNILVSTSVSNGRDGIWDGFGLSEVMQHLLHFVMNDLGWKMERKRKERKERKAAAALHCIHRADMFQADAFMSVLLEGDPEANTVPAVGAIIHIPSDLEIPWFPSKTSGRCCWWRDDGVYHLDMLPLKTVLWEVNVKLNTKVTEKTTTIGLSLMDHVERSAFTFYIQGMSQSPSHRLNNYILIISMTTFPFSITVKPYSTILKPLVKYWYSHWRCSNQKCNNDQ